MTKLTREAFYEAVERLAEEILSLDYKGSLAKDAKNVLAYLEEEDDENIMHV